MIENTAKNFVSNKTQIDPADVISRLGYYQLNEATIAIIGEENLLTRAFKPIAFSLSESFRNTGCNRLFIQGSLCSPGTWMHKRTRPRR